MKQIHSFILVLWMTLSSITTFCQQTAAEQANQLASSLEPAVSRPQPLFSEGTLNVFFTKRVASYLSSSTDLNFAKGYALLDNKDGRLFVGGTWNIKKEKFNKTSLLVTSGVKTNVKDGFSTLFDKDGWQRDIGLSFKLTIVGNGTIGYSGHRDTIERHRKRLKYEFAQQLEAQIDKEKKELTLEYPNAVSPGSAEYANDKMAFDKAFGKFMEKKTSEFLYTLYEREADDVYKNDWYTYAHDHWAGIEIYIPLTRSRYLVADSIQNSSFAEKTYRPFDASVFYTNVLELPKVGKFFMTFTGSLALNNTARNEDLTAYNFEQYIQQSALDTLNVVRVDEDKVYVGNFEEFFSPRLSGKFIWQPCPYFGLSAAGEAVYRHRTSASLFTDSLNWMLGIPISLNDKDGKPTVNFELQWKEVSGEHSVGLSLSYAFGQSALIR